MKKKGFVHIKEYDLTKMILDRLDIDIEDDYVMINGIEPLQYKDKPLILPDYKDYMAYMNRGVVFRPFSNLSHAQYLINMFSDINSCTVIFEYMNSERVKKDEDVKLYDGVLVISDDEKKMRRRMTFRGVRNISVLMTATVMKSIMDYDAFHALIYDILKIDKKIV